LIARFCEIARINLLRHTQRVTDELLDNMTRESNLAMLKNAAKDWNGHIVGDSPLPEVVLEGDYYSHFDERGAFDPSDSADQSMSRDFKQEREEYFKSRKRSAEFKDYLNRPASQDLDMVVDGKTIKIREGEKPADHLPNSYTSFRIQIC
jgi:putative sterol carrier protein